jgi:hypothetical protein
VVGAIAVGQLAVAILVALRGRAAQLGLVGAIAFLLAIAPLGRGSAFPFSLVASLAAALLLRPPFHTTLVSDLRGLVRRRRAQMPSSAPSARGTGSAIERHDQAPGALAHPR